MEMNDWKKLITETKENLSEGGNWRSLVPKVADATDGKYKKVQEFINALLIDCQFYDEAKKVDNFMNKL